MSRRNKSTEYLKECLGDALFSLMEEKPIEKITATELTDKAGVGRATFFRHFGSKQEVITYKLVCLWDQWAKDHKLEDAGPFSLLNTKDLFAFNLHYRKLIEQIYEANMQTSIYDAFYQIMMPFFGTDMVQSYANRFYSYGTFGLLDEWVHRGFKETPDQMADIVLKEIVGRNISLSK